MADFDILSIAGTPEDSEKLKRLLERTDLPEVRDPEKISENDMIDHAEFMRMAGVNGWNLEDPEVKELLDAVYDIAAESTNYMAATFPNEPHETTEQQTAALEALLLDAAGGFSQDRISKYSLNVVQRAIEGGHLEMEQESLRRELESLDKESGEASVEEMNQRLEEEDRKLAEEGAARDEEDRQLEEENRQLEEEQIREEAAAQEPAAAGEEPPVPDQFDGYVRYYDFFSTSDGSVRDALQDAGIPFIEDAAHGLGYEPTVNTAFTLYLLSEEGMGTEDLKKLNSLSPDEKRELGRRFVQACEDHPVMPGKAASDAEAQQNAAWFGRMTANAVGKIKSEGVRFPSAEEIGDPEKDMQLRQSSFELLGNIGKDFGNLTSTWFKVAGENSFAQGYGSVEKLQNDRNILSAAHVVSRAAGMTGRSLDDGRIDRLKRQVKEELLPGVEGQPADQLNSQANRMKGTLLEEKMKGMMSGVIIRDAVNNETAELFNRLRPAPDDLRLDPYIVMPDLASMDPEALDQAAADFDAIFRPLQEKEQPAFDLGGGSLTKGFLIHDATVQGADRDYNITSVVKEALGDRQVSAEELAKYEKAYALHMLADPDRKFDVSYRPHFVNQTGTAQDPVWTAESVAQDPRYDISSVRKAELDDLEKSITEMRTARAQEYRAREELQAAVNEMVDANARLHSARAEDLNKIRESYGYSKLEVIDAEEGVQERAAALALMKEQHQAQIEEETTAMRLAYEQREQQRREAFRIRRETAREQAAQTRERRMLRRQQQEEERQRLAQAEERRQAEREERARVRREARIAESIRREEEATRLAEEARIQQEEDRRRRQEERSRRREEIRRRREEINALRERNRARQEEIAGQKAQMRAMHDEAVRVQQINIEERRRIAQERELQLAKEREQRAAREKVAREGYPKVSEFLKAAYENGWDAHTDKSVLKTLYLIYANNKGDNTTKAQKEISQEAKALVADIGLNRVNSLEERGAVIGRMKEMVSRYNIEDMGAPEDAGRLMFAKADGRIADWNTAHPTKSLQRVLDDLEPLDKAKQARYMEKLRLEEEQRQRREAEERERREAQEKQRREEKERAERERQEQERVRQAQEKAREEEAARARREREERQQRRRDRLHAQYALEWNNRDEFYDAAKKNGWAPDGVNLPEENRRALKALYYAYGGLVDAVERDLASQAEIKLCGELKPVMTEIGTRPASSLERIRIMTRAAKILEENPVDENSSRFNQLNNAKLRISEWQKKHPDPLTRENITLERFMQAARENGWASGRDDEALETIFNNWKNQKPGTETETAAWNAVNSIAQERLNELKPVTDRNERLRDAAERFSADKKVSDTLTAAANRMEAGEEQENLKERRRISLRKIRDNEFVYEYDAFLPMAFNSMFQQNGEYHDQIRKLVRGAEEGEYYGKDGSERFLKELKSIVDNIPEEKRTQAQKELADRFDEMLKEADSRIEARENYTRSAKLNWHDDQRVSDDLFDALYRAAEGMPQDHRYRKVLEDIRLGRSEEHPELNGKMGNSKSFVVMNDLMHRVEDILKNEYYSRVGDEARKAAGKEIRRIQDRVVIGNTGPEDIEAISKAAQAAKSRIGQRDPEVSALLDEAAGFSSLDAGQLFGRYDKKTVNAISHLREGVTKYLDKAKVRDRRSDVMLDILGHLDTKLKADYEHKLEALPEEKDWWKDSQTFKAEAKANGWVSEKDQDFLDSLHSLDRVLKEEAGRERSKDPGEQKQQDAQNELLAKTSALIGEIAENKVKTAEERRAYVERFENFCEPYLGTDVMGLMSRAYARPAMEAADQWHTAFPSIPTSENVNTRNLTRALLRMGWDEKRDGAMIDAIVKAHSAVGAAEKKAIWKDISDAMTHTLSKDKPLANRDEIVSKIRAKVPNKPEMEPVIRQLDQCMEATKSLKELEDPGKYKKAFESNVTKNGFLREYMPVILDAYGTGFGRGGKYEESVREELKKAQEEDHSTKERCVERLNAIKRKLDLIPDYLKTKEQKDFADGFDARMQKIAQSIAAAEKRKQFNALVEQGKENWTTIGAIGDLYARLALAAEGMEANHPFHKVVENFRKGTCDRVPGLNGKSEGDKNFIVFQELVQDAIGILEKEKNQTKEIADALDYAKRRQRDTRNTYLVVRNPASVINEIGYRGKCALERAGEYSEELTNILRKAEGFSRLDKSQLFSQYKEETIQEIEGLEKDLRGYLDKAGAQDRGAAEALLILEKLNPVQMAAYREKFAGLEPVKQELANRNENLRTYGDEMRAAGNHAQGHGYESAYESYRLLPIKTDYLLSTNGKLDELAQLFDTRKTGMFSGDTRYYTNAKTALDTYINNRNQIAQQISALAANVANGTISVQQFREQAGQHMEQLQQHENRLKEQMRKYAIHATDGSIRRDTLGSKTIDKMTKSAGAARLTASMGILEYLNNAASLVPGAQVQEMTRTNRNHQRERAKEISFQDLYRQNMQTDEVRGIENAEERRKEAVRRTRRTLRDNNWRGPNQNQH